MWQPIAQLANSEPVASHTVQTMRHVASAQFRHVHRASLTMDVPLETFTLLLRATESQKRCRFSLCSTAEVSANTWVAKAAILAMRIRRYRGECFSFLLYLLVFFIIAIIFPTLSVLRSIYWWALDLHCSILCAAGNICHRLDEHQKRVRLLPLVILIFGFAAYAACSSTCRQCCVDGGGGAGVSLRDEIFFFC